MTICIDKKIVKYNVVKEPEQVKTATVNSDILPVQMHENIERPDVLFGATYKIRTPLSEHALYITINDMVFNEHTPQEQRRPFEIFINSKNMDHFQWIVALTRIISSLFRKGGDVTFLVEELRSVFDPKGGYFKRGGKYMPSLIAELGDVIESHLRAIGMIKETELDTCQKEFVAQKRAEYLKDHDSEFPANAKLCIKCQTKALIITNGCTTCLNCGDSKCG